MHGLHLTADLRGCAAGHGLMTDPEALRTLCLRAVATAGLTAVRDVFHGFERSPDEQPAGITGVVLLAESHLAVHTWPELDAATLDVYVCNRGHDNSARAEALMRSLLKAFDASAVERHSLCRGWGHADEGAPMKACR